MEPIERTDYEEMGARYDAGRMLSEEGLADWRRVLGEYLPPEADSPVLDLGCGTGMFAGYLSRWFGVPVVGVEPAAAMLDQARARRGAEGVELVRGEASSIPLADDSCSAAWLSVSLHHFPDLTLAAKELRRVLPSGAPGAYPPTLLRPHRRDHMVPLLPGG